MTKIKGLPHLISTVALTIYIQVFTTDVFAAQSVLTLTQARTSAMADNPGLAQMQARYEALTHIAPQKRSLPDPVLSLNAMNLPWNSFDRNQEPMTQMQVGISQMFPFPGKLGLREDIAELMAEAAFHSVEEMRLHLDMNVAMTWWEIYFLDRSLDTVLQNQSLLRQFVKVAQKKYEVGKGLQQDVLLAQLELSKLLDQEIQLQAMRRNQEIQLNVLMNVSPNAPVQLPSLTSHSEVTLAPESRLHQQAMSVRPVLNEKLTVVEASDSQLKLARKDFYPDFKLGAAYGNRDDDQLGRGRDDFFSVMFSVSLPLYAGTKQSEAVKQRSGELVKNRYALLDERNRVLADVSRSVTDFNRASQQVILFGSGIVPQARQTTESMLAGYQVDEVDFLNLVRSQITLFNYELHYWKAVTDVEKSKAKLIAAVGEENIYE
ncbi:MAG: cobalt-zinc-cadmium efflux system outer membrane protein [Halieaceae bacterium]|jgi:cobalt-zinc-cadmium efflux system outer membrane protein